MKPQFPHSEIRLAVAEDLTELSTIELAAARIFPDGMLPDLARHETLEMERLQAGQEEGRLAVACKDGVAVGFALVEILAPGFALLAEMDVHPAHARQGLGSSLVQWAIDWARQTGFSRVGLTTFHDLPWNAPFYQKFGFQEMEPAEIPSVLKTCLEQEERAGMIGRVALLLQL